MTSYILKILVFLVIVLYSFNICGQSYRSNRHAYSYSSSSTSVVRLAGPEWVGPHPGCMMCMGNHLISTHGKSYFYLNRVGWQQWATIHDNVHNQRIKTRVSVQKSDPNLIFVPTSQNVVEEMLRVAEIQPNDILYDLGCGDGRIVITAAQKYGIRAVGYEINPDLVKVAKSRVGFLNAVEIKQQDILTVDLTPATVIALYLFPELNKKLVPQFKKMSAGSRIVSHYHKVPGLIEDGVFHIDGHAIYLYKIKQPTYVGYL